MAGGLEGRLLREQIRAQRLDNAQRAAQMVSPEQILREAGMLETLIGAAQGREQSAALHPGALLQQDLGNQAAQMKLDQAPQLMEQQSAQHQMALDSGVLQNKLKELQVADFEPSIQREQEAAQREEALKRAGIDVARINANTGTLNTAAAQGNIMDILRNYLPSIGLEGEITPIQSMMEMLGGGRQQGPSPETMEIMEAIRRANANSQPID